MTAKRFKIQAGGQTSEIRVGVRLAALPKALATLARPGARIVVVADAAVAGTSGRSLEKGLSRAGFQAGLIVIPSGERSKSLAMAAQLVRRLARQRLERSSWLVALGGGVVGDLTGFVAATFLRGLPFIQVPTTLLAQVDAAIGGKTGVDLPEGKNLVGAFYQPRLVWIDPTQLRTLPREQIRNGMAEIIKYGAIRDRRLFAALERQVPALMRGYSAAWDPIIARCAGIKAEVVGRDPHERTGLRAILNFGHSVGHAIEAARGYRAELHGEAVSIGMGAAASISQQLGLMKGEDRIRLNALLTRAGLPTRVRQPIPRRRLMAFLGRDKKAEGGAVRFALLQGLGKAISGQRVPGHILDRALAECGL